MFFSKRAKEQFDHYNRLLIWNALAKKIGVEMKKRKGNVIIYIFILFSICLGAYIFYFKFFPEKSYTAEQLGITEIKSKNDKDNDGIDDYSDIMLGARDYIKTNPKYKSKYYDGGYPNDGYGVCTDVIWNGFMAAGYNIKSMIDTDIENNLEEYRTIEIPEPNIDFRRVKNLRVFFERNAEVLTPELAVADKWQPGDIVVFTNHIAICSDKRNKEGYPFIIHHDGMGAREKNDIEKYAIVGHYRWNNNHVLP